MCILKVQLEHVCLLDQYINLLFTGKKVFLLVKTTELVVLFWQFSPTNSFLAAITRVGEAVWPGVSQT